MLHTILSLVLLLVALGLLWYLVGLLPLPAPIKQLVDVLFIIGAILVVLGAFTGAVPPLRVP